MAEKSTSSRLSSLIANRNLDKTTLRTIPVITIAMKIASKFLVFLSVVGAVVGYSPSTSSRRKLLQDACAAIGGVATVGLVNQPAYAIDACPRGSQNCIRTTWTAPAGTSKADIIKTVKDVLSSYPQEGQTGADLGGWTIVEDNLEGAGTARVEYKSGIGNFAKFLNGGKPFVDDLKVEIADGGVEIRSSSRVGDSDLGVNQKRLKYLASAIKAKGWSAPEPKY